MFPLRKLAELSPRTRLRKIARILHALELDFLRGGSVDAEYLSRLAGLCAPAPGHGEPKPGADKDIKAPDGPGGAAEAVTVSTPVSGIVASSASALVHALQGGAAQSELARRINVLRNDILGSLGAEPSEWDLLEGESGKLDRSGVATFPIAAYLEDVRSPFNVGSMFRTAEAFGAERMLLSPRTPLPTHPRARKTGRGAETAVPWSVRALDSLKGEPGIFALELGGVAIQEFGFPSRGIVLVGSEELGLSPEALAMADAGLGRVSITLSGAKKSLNVSVAFGILMSRWHESLLPH